MGMQEGGAGGAIVTLAQNKGWEKKPELRVLNSKPTALIADKNIVNLIRLLFSTTLQNHQ